MAAHSEQISDGIVEREKPLGVPCGFESAHLPLPLTRRLMRDFGAIVGISVYTATHVAEYASHGSGVAFQFVGDDPQRFRTLTAQESSKESLSGALIAMRLGQNVDYVAVLIHGTPQILLLAADSNEHLIQVPVVPEPALSSLQSPSIVRTEFLTPPSDRLVGHDDCPLGQKILDVSEAQAEAMVNPDRMGG